MKLIIAGGRNYRLTPEDYDKLDALLPRITEVITGGADGADDDGDIWARMNNLRIRSFAADWKKYGRAAGPIRNRTMAEYADAVALFPGGRGTQSMYREAVRAGIKIFDWRK